jgi:beta-glucosidase-like glycosyl hydrolase
MDEVELAPFRAAMEAGVPMIMTAHVNTPGMSDKDLPATLNPDILTGLLRNELGYEGLILTDAMEMGAITEHYGEAESIILAVEAGADMLLVPVSLDRAWPCRAAASPRNVLMRRCSAFWT